MFKFGDTTDDTHPWRIIVLDGIIQFRRGQKKILSEKRWFRYLDLPSFIFQRRLFEAWFWSPRSRLPLRLGQRKSRRNKQVRRFGITSCYASSEYGATPWRMIRTLRQMIPTSKPIVKATSELTKNYICDETVRNRIEADVIVVVTFSDFFFSSSILPPSSSSSRSRVSSRSLPDKSTSSSSSSISLILIDQDWSNVTACRKMHPGPNDVAVMSRHSFHLLSFFVPPSKFSIHSVSTGTTNITWV